jgi:hypothetical protein
MLMLLALIGLARLTTTRVIKGKHEISKRGGLYQIYCNHFEDNTLMYIGITENSFSSRIRDKKNWLEWESKLPMVYLGQIVNLSPKDNHLIFLKRAERLLIYFCSPPVNKQEKDSFKSVSSEPNTLIINYNRRFRLPYVVSNLVEKPHIFGRAGKGTLGKAREEVRESPPI